jgi:hypothetical protein
MRTLRDGVWHGEWFDARSCADLRLLLSLEAFVAEPFGRLITLADLQEVATDMRKVAA